MLSHETIRKFAEEIVMNHNLENMEAVLYKEGDYFIRQSGSMWFREDNIIVKIPLGQAYWGESSLWGKDLDDLTQMDHIMDALIEDIYFRIEDWEEQQAEVKKMMEHFEEERKAYEDMFGL